MSNSPFSTPKKRVFFRATQGVFCKGYESKGDFVNFGTQFKGRLIGVSDKPEEEKAGKVYPESWELAFDCAGDQYVFSMAKKEWKCAPLFSAMANLSHDDLKRPLELVAWSRKPTKEKPKPTVFVFLKKNNFMDDVPPKYPKLRDDQAPVDGVVYMPSKEPMMNGTSIVKVNGYTVWDDSKEIAFIRENILPGLYEALEDANFADEVPGGDYLAETEDDLPATVSNAPANEIKQKVGVNQVAGSNLAPLPTAPPEEEPDELPF